MYYAPILPLGDWVEEAPWKSSHVLIIAPQANRAENTVTGKRDLLAATSTGPLLVVWAGQWSTTVRKVTRAERTRIKQVFGPL
jgi:hypothetical protein